MQEIFQNSKVTLSLEPCHFLLARLMPRRVAIFWTGGSDTFAKLRFKVSSLRVSCRGGKTQENVSADRCLLAFTWQFGARNYLAKIGGEGALDTGQRKCIGTLEDPLREREREKSRESRRGKRATTCSNDWWAFKGVSTPHSLPSLSFSWTKDLRIGMHSHENGAWLQPCR